uniref:DUF1656 domain-containing protein n=1 Tax=uncultured Sphingomonas sp. TaxID=158754 RepID=UPI0035CC88D2
MIGEIDLGGVFLSPLLLCLVGAFGARLGLSWLLARAGLYPVVWNRPLFDLSLFIILVGAAMLLLRVFSS